MNGTSSTTQRFSREVQLFVSIFAVMVALTYGTGFLCVYTFLERFGIREIGGEFLKGKYIYVGILFLFFPISVLCPAIFALSIRRIQKKMQLAINDKTRIPLSSYFLFFNLGFTFYVYVLFLPPSLGQAKQTEITAPLIILASMVGPFLIPRFVDRVIAPDLRTAAARIFRWMMVCLIVGVLDFFTFYGFWKHLWVILWGEQGLIPVGAIYYFVFMSLIPFTILTTNVRRHEFHKRASALFSAGEITDPVSFTKKLSETSNPLSAFLLERMGVEAKACCTASGQANVPSQTIEAILIPELNKIVSGAPVHEIQRFQHVTMRPQTNELLKKNPAGHELMRLNRLLLEDAYPSELLSIEKKDPIMTRGVMELEINTLCLCLMFYFLATVAFGLKVYPRIPVAKGGGSYVNSPIIALHFRALTNAYFVDRYITGSNAFVVIEQTSTSIFLAATNDAGGPEHWETMRESDLPSVFELKRDMVSEMKLR